VASCHLRNSVSVIITGAPNEVEFKHPNEVFLGRMDVVNMQSQGLPGLTEVPTPIFPHT